MKKIIIILIFIFSLSAVHADNIFPGPDILSDGRWYNDEYSFDFSKDGTYVAYYTFGKKSGSMKGSIIYKSGDNFLIIKKGTVKNTFDTSFIPPEGVKLFFANDPANPKSSRYLHDESSTLVLWNKNYNVKEGVETSVENIPVVTMGYKLSATTSNLRIRKGPGTEFEYMTFYFKDKKSGEVKSWGSILEGTNIRVLARTKEKVKVNDWNNYWYYIEYKEPKGSLMVYRNAWCFAEFIMGEGDVKHKITIISPKNEKSFYDEYEVKFIGSVTGTPDKVKVQIKGSDGIVTREDETSYSSANGAFSYTASTSDDTLYYGSNIYNFIAVYPDGRTTASQITIYIHQSAGEMGKPVIYLYPKKELNVKVTVKPENGVSKSEPKYNNGWDVTAKPDGTIINKADSKTYPYLFWEAPASTMPSFSTGFVVKTKDLSPFFDSKLSYMGMNDKEIKDFKEFWIPLLNKGEYYCIRFYSSDEINKDAPLEIIPSPDSIIRIYFESKPLDRPIQINEQQLVKGERKGFTVIEWGGRRN